MHSTKASASHLQRYTTLRNYLHMPQPSTLRIYCYTCRKQSTLPQTTFHCRSMLHLPQAVCTAANTLHCQTVYTVYTATNYVALPQTVCTATNTLHCQTVYTLHTATDHVVLPQTVCTAANTQCHRRRHEQKQPDRGVATGAVSSPLLLLLWELSDLYLLLPGSPVRLAF